MFFNIFISFIIDAFIARYELLKKGGDEDEDRHHVASFYATFNDPEYDIVAQSQVKGTEDIYRRMFADELAEITASFEEQFVEEARRTARPRLLRLPSPLLPTI